MHTDQLHTWRRTLDSREARLVWNNSNAPKSKPSSNLSSGFLDSPDGASSMKEAIDRIVSDADRGVDGTLEGINYAKMNNPEKTLSAMVKRIDDLLRAPAEKDPVSADILQNVRDRLAKEEKNPKLVNKENPVEDTSAEDPRGHDISNAINKPMIEKSRKAQGPVTLPNGHVVAQAYMRPGGVVNIHGTEELSKIYHERVKKQMANREDDETDKTAEDVRKEVLEKLLSELAVNLPDAKGLSLDKAVVLQPVTEDIPNSLLVKFSANSPHLPGPVSVQFGARPQSGDALYILDPLNPEATRVVVGATKSIEYGQRLTLSYPDSNRKTAFKDALVVDTDGKMVGTIQSTGVDPAGANNAFLRTADHYKEEENTYAGRRIV